MAESITVVTDEGLEYFKSKQDTYNNGKFAKPADLPSKVSDLTNDSGYQTESQVQALINAAVSSVVRWKGVKATESELPSTGNTVGDVWHVNDNGGEYAWNGTEWEQLGNSSGIIVDWGSVQGKPSTFTPSAHTHTTSQITDFPASMPASDVSAWAKSPTKPTYTASEVGAAAASHSHAAMTAATSSSSGQAGFVPAPAAGKQASYLRGDGTWAVPPNTTYAKATSSADGLMAKEDKARLDGMPDMTAMTTGEIDALFA